MMTEPQVILLVEDNPDDAELTRIAFEEVKITNKLVIAHDGVEALEMLLGENPIKPAMILLDLKLPKLNGIEVLRRLRNDDRTRLTPIVVLTSSREQRDLVESYQLGANSFIQKPVDFEQFVEAARQLGLYWLVLNQSPANA
ncbi:MAG: response regulator [Wenzhouxiangellaceae bacterium]